MDEYHSPPGDESEFSDEPVIRHESDLWDAEIHAFDGARGVVDTDLHSVAVEQLEGVILRRRMFVAEEYRIIADVLREAHDEPDPWVGPDPTLDPAWFDPRDRSVATVRRERRDIAVRAAAADVAIRMRMSEQTVRTRAGQADVLRERTPQLWAAFLGGGVVEQNAVAAAQLAASLPADAPESWAALDERIVGIAGVLTPAKFRVAARAAREHVHAESIEQRHKRAAADRGVWTAPELDGMASLLVRGPAADVYAAYGRVDAMARHLAAQDGEERTLAQLRADVLADLLATGEIPGAAESVKPKGGVAITIPVMTLLGESDEPAILSGYGPIDLDTAKRLAGEATSWVRILTDPVTGTVLDIDRRTRRVPADLKRWLGVTHPTCIFPGCSRPARECDLDHRIDWQYGGTTSSDNLGPVCEHHHRVKHESLWQLYRCPVTGVTWWVSPTGARAESDPPPF